MIQFTTHRSLWALTQQVLSSASGELLFSCSKSGHVLKEKKKEMAQRHGHYRAKIFILMAQGSLLYTLRKSRWEKNWGGGGHCPPNCPSIFLPMLTPLLVILTNWVPRTCQAHGQKDLDFSGNAVVVSFLRKIKTCYCMFLMHRKNHTDLLKEDKHVLAYL